MARRGSPDSLAAMRALTGSRELHLPLPSFRTGRQGFRRQGEEGFGQGPVPFADRGIDPVDFPKNLTPAWLTERALHGLADEETKALRVRRALFASRSMRVRRGAGRLTATLVTAMFIPPSYQDSLQQYEQRQRYASRTEWYRKAAQVLTWGCISRCSEILQHSC